MRKAHISHRFGRKSERPKPSYKLAVWSLVVTVLILALKVLPYTDRW